MFSQSRHQARTLRALLVLLIATFAVLAFSVDTAWAHVSRERAELIVKTDDEGSTGRLIVHRDIVTPELSGAWAQGLLAAGCPVTGRGEPGDAGGLAGGVVIELQWACDLTYVDLSALLRTAGLSMVVVEFDGTTVNATATAPVVDASGAHSTTPVGRESLVALAVLGAVVVLAVWMARPGRASAGPIRTRRRRLLAVAAGGLAVIVLTPAAVLAAPSSLALTTVNPTPGQSLTFRYVTDAPATKNWVGIYAPGDTPGPVPSRVWAYAPAADGTVTLSGASLGVGTWTARFFANDGYEQLSTPVTFTIAAVPADPVTVEGTVFKDLDADGVRDTGESGMAGVSITDGEVWALSRTDGTYSIQLDRARRETDLVTIVSPNGYTPKLRADYVPQFFREVPVGPSPRTGLDFALVPDSNAANPVEKWSLVSDMEVANRTDAEPPIALARWTGQVQALAEARQATMTITTGDLTVTDYVDASRRQGGFGILRNGLTAGKLGHPFYPVIGNHDFGGTATSSGYGGSVEYWRRNLGPEWYSFDRNGRHIVVLEDNYDASSLSPQLMWLREDLRRHAVGKQVLVFAHRSLFTQWGPGAGIQPIVDELARYDVRMFAAGHNQQAEFRRGAFARSVEVNNMGVYGIDGAGPDYKILDFAAITDDPNTTRNEDTGYIGGTHRQFDVNDDVAMVSPAAGSVHRRRAGTDLRRRRRTHTCERLSGHHQRRQDRVAQQQSVAVREGVPYQDRQLLHASGRGC